MPERPPIARAHERNLGLDVVRAVAIVLVMVSHWTNNIGFWLGLKPPPALYFAGTLGVELFFALSGFLIGRILLDIAEQAPTGRNLLAFLARRWMRTLPLYFLWLAALFLFWPPRHHVGRYALEFGTLTQNLLQPMPGDFFFAVSWSLTIEEWFYLLFGAAIIGCAAFWRSRHAVWVPLLFFLMVPLALRLAIFGLAARPDDYADLVVLRLDEIAYGVLLATLHGRRPGLFRHPLPLLGLGLLLVGVVWSGRLALPPLLFRALVHNVTVIGCALCLPAALALRLGPNLFTRAIRRISAWSYGLYMIHLTIIVDLVQGLWSVHRISTPVAVALALVLPFPLAALSFRFFEQPILGLRPALRLPGGRRRGAAPGPDRIAFSDREAVGIEVPLREG